MKGISSKKKFIVASVIVGVVLLGAIISVVAVLAAATQTVTSTINVNYRVTDVSATVTASYGLEKFWDGTAEGTTATDAGSIDFEAEGTTTGSITGIEPANLTSKYNYITFEYGFKNNSTLAYTVTCTGIPSANNMILKYLVSDTEIADSSWDTTETGWTTFTTAADIKENSDLVKVAGNGEKYIYIRATVEDLDKSADFDGNFGWQLDAVASEVEGNN